MAVVGLRILVDPVQHVVHHEVVEGRDDDDLGAVGAEQGQDAAVVAVANRVRARLQPKIITCSILSNFTNLLYNYSYLPTDMHGVPAILPPYVQNPSGPPSSKLGTRLG